MEVSSSLRHSDNRLALATLMLFSLTGAACHHSAVEREPGGQALPVKVSAGHDGRLPGQLASRLALPPQDPTSLVPSLILAADQAQVTNGAGSRRSSRTAFYWFGQRRLSLVADPPRVYSFDLEIPPRAALNLALAADAPTRFMVRVAAQGQPPVVLLDKSSKKPRWSRQRISLHRLAGQKVRLELMTRPLNGRRGFRAAWGEPTMVRDAL